MDYISPDRSLEGACGDPGPLFGDHDGSLLEHMGFHGDPQHVSPQLNEGLLVDSTDQISYLAADSPSFMNDQIPCNTMKSASTSPASPLKQADDHHVHIDSDMENDAAEQNLHDSYSEAQTTSLGYGIHRRTEVADAAQPTELHESNGNNDTSNFQEETTQSDTYLGDAMLNENGSRDYQLNNSGADDDEIPNSPALEMEDVDTRALHETSHDEKYEAEDDQMNGRNSSPCDEHDEDNCNSVIEPSYLDVMEHENPGTKNGMLTPSNQWDSPPESSARLEKGTPSPDRMVSLPVGRSPRTHSPKELDSPRPENEKKGFAQEERLTKERLSIKEKGLTKEGLPIKEKGLTKEGLPIKEKGLTKEGLPIKEKRLTKEGLPIKEKGLTKEGLPIKEKRLTKEGLSIKEKGLTKEGLPIKEKGLTKEGLPIKEKGLTKEGLPIKEKGLTKEGIPIKEKRFTKEGLPIKEKGLTKEVLPIKEKGLTKKGLPIKEEGLPTKEAQKAFTTAQIISFQSSRPWSPPANRKTGLGKPGRNLFVAGFSYATTERDLEKKFSKYGRVTSARVVRDKRSGDSRGFGFLSLEKDEDADAAIRACDETEWNGRIILGPAADKRELIPFNVCNLCAQDVMPCQICTRRSSSSSWSPADLAKWLSSTALRGMNGIQICEALILNRLVDLPIIYSNVGSNHHVYICTFAR
uniref:RRM domain-containing protein n=1 Tax=Oryza rufipogon TaxID=4529 RepID=A0A0E0MWC4_ORYRU